MVTDVADYLFSLLIQAKVLLKMYAKLKILKLTTEKRGETFFYYTRLENLYAKL